MRNVLHIHKYFTNWQSTIINRIIENLRLQSDSHFNNDKVLCYEGCIIHENSYYIPVKIISTVSRKKRFLYYFLNQPVKEQGTSPLKEKLSNKGAITG